MRLEGKGGLLCLPAASAKVAARQTLNGFQ